MVRGDYNQRIYSERIADLKREIRETTRVLISSSQAGELYEICGRSVHLSARQFNEYSLMMFESEGRTPSVEEIIKKIREANSPRQSS